MSEVRFNLITGDWVVIATERAKRPEDFCRPKPKKDVPSFVATCPFCPGNEDKTPQETLAVTDSIGKWLVRAVPNKFSAFSPDTNVVRHKTDFKQSITGFGLHEVIIETPEHNMTTALLPVNHIEKILSVYKDRMIAFYEDSSIEHVIIFKNHGGGAGTSLEHAHSQIVGTPVFPGQVMTRLGEAIKYYYYVNFGECLFCSNIQGERNDGVRVIDENDSFIAYIPYGALSPFHLWIFPKRHRGCYVDITDTELSDLAAILKEILLKLCIGLDNPDYNYMIRSLSPRESGCKYFHWYVAIVPRVSQMAGFELGTGMYINTALPEVSAQFLRGVKVP
jgi:UDPglucose--hexose-1-phosphate uridylyltransferase